MFNYTIIVFNIAHAFDLISTAQSATLYSYEGGHYAALYCTLHIELSMNSIFAYLYSRPWLEKVHYLIANR